MYVCSATLTSGTQITLSPNPATGGSWSWSGLGTSGTSRIQTITPTASGTATATYTNACGAQSAQIYTVTLGVSTGIVSGGTYRITPRHSEKAIIVQGAGTTNGTLVQQNTYSGATNQQWVFTSVGNNWRVSPANATAMGLDVASYSTADAAKVQIYTYGGGTNQQWQAVDMGNGYYQLKASHSGKCLTVVSGSTADGASVQQYTCNSSSNYQQFLVTRLKSALEEVAADLQSDIIIYPNPLEGVMTIEGLAGETSIRLVDINGQVVKEQLVNDKSSVQVDLNLKPGVYVVRVINGKKTTVKKIVVK